MRRRSVLGSLGFAALAGCSRLPAGESPTTTGTDETPVANLHVESFTVEGPVEIGAPVPIEVTIRNSGTLAGRYTSDISHKIGTGEWHTTGDSLSVDVGVGATETERVELDPVAVMAPATYRLDTTETTATTVFVGASIPWGSTHALPDGVELGVGRPHLQSSYTYSTADGEETAAPPEGEQWAVYTITASNTADAERTAPDLIDVILHREDDEFRGETFSGENEQQYRGGPLSPGESRSGEVPCDIPADIAVADLRVEYAMSYDAGDVEVAWRSE